MKTKKILLLILPLFVAGNVFAVTERTWTAGNYRYEFTEKGVKVTLINPTSQAPAIQNQGQDPSASPSYNLPELANPNTIPDNHATLPHESEIIDAEQTVTPSDQPALSSQPEQATEQDTQTATDDSEPKESLMETIVDFVQEATASIFNGFAGLFKIFKF